MNLRKNNIATDNESENKNINIVANAAFKKSNNPREQLQHSAEQQSKKTSYNITPSNKSRKEISI